MSDTEPRSASQPLTEEQIRQATIGEPTRVNGPITLVEYDPAWPDHFACEERRIRDALGERALRIEHIGSTAVPRLIAKPIIDILLVVADSADEPAYVYAQTKRDLAARHWTYVQNYADAKSEVVEAIIARARATSLQG